MISMKHINMNNVGQQHFNELYQQHLLVFASKGCAPSTIDAYARVMRLITEFFDKIPDTLTMQD